MHKIKSFLLLPVIAVLFATEGRAALSATGFIPVGNRQLTHGQSAVLVPYTVKNTGTAAIREIRISIPDGFTYVSNGSVEVTAGGYPQGKIWNANHSGGTVTLTAHDDTAALANSESIYIPLYVATRDTPLPAATWSCLVESTTSVTAPATEETEGSMHVSIVVLWLQGQAGVTTLLPGATTTITAILLDDFDRPITSTAIAFSVLQGNGAIVTASPGLTDSSGRTTVIYRASAATGVDRILLTYAQDTTGYVTIDVIDPPPALAIDATDAGNGTYFIKEQTAITLAPRTGWSVQYRIDEDPWQDYNASFSLGARLQGAHVLQYRHKDLNGAPGGVFSASLRLTQLDSRQDTLYNFPNPFAAGAQTTVFEYYLTADSGVSLQLYDLFGQKVWSREIAAGEAGARTNDWNQIVWDGRNEAGMTVANGGYIGVLTINTTGKKYYRKIAVIK